MSCHGLSASSSSLGTHTMHILSADGNWLIQSMDLVGWKPNLMLKNKFTFWLGRMVLIPMSFPMQMGMLTKWWLVVQDMSGEFEGMTKSALSKSMHMWHVNCFMAVATSLLSYMHQKEWSDVDMMGCSKKHTSSSVSGFCVNNTASSTVVWGRPLSASKLFGMALRSKGRSPPVGHWNSGCYRCAWV